jgi:hypothetical protein
MKQNKIGVNHLRRWCLVRFRRQIDDGRHKTNIDKNNFRFTSLFMYVCHETTRWLTTRLLPDLAYISSVKNVARAVRYVDAINLCLKRSGSSFYGLHRRYFFSIIEVAVRSF